MGKLTIGVGRNLSDVGLHDDEIALLLTNDMAWAEAAVRKHVPAFDDLTDFRKAVLANMMFNMGDGIFSAFTTMLKAVNDGRWDDAADAMLASHWAAQVKGRANRLADQMRAG